MAESAEEKKDRLPGSNLLSKLLIKKIKKSRAKKAQRGKVKEAKKAATTKLSDKQASQFEKFAGVKSTVTPKKRQAGDKIASAKPKAKVVQPKKKGLPKVDSTAGMTFNQAFAAARKAGQKRFEWRGKSYNTKLKGEENKAKHGGALAIMIAPVKTKKMKAVKKAPGGASMGKMKMMKKGGKLKPVPSEAKGLSKLPTSVRNKMGYMKMGGRMGSKEMMESIKKDDKMLKHGGKVKDKMMYGGAMKKAMYGAKMKKKAMYGAKMKKK